MKKLLFFLLMTSCTQSFLSYVKSDNSEPLLDFESFLAEGGLIAPDLKERKTTAQQTNKVYPSGILKPNQQVTLVQLSETIAVPKNSQSTLTVRTKNYLIARPYFSSEGLILSETSSNPQKGEFSFYVGDKGGKVIIRLYHPETGILQEEVTFYIDTK